MGTNVPMILGTNAPMMGGNCPGGNVVRIREIRSYILGGEQIRIFGQNIYYWATLHFRISVPQVINIYFSALKISKISKIRDEFAFLGQNPPFWI